MVRCSQSSVGKPEVPERCYGPFILLTSLYNDGFYLIEVDRILRPGGYWILSGPPIHWKKHWRDWERTQEDLKQEQDAIENVAKSLCWKKVVE
ncbi:hypothetical protein Nepgr_013670 [Nepenthes gracilis]|uniref:Methyltransferase n=1 Tax=Nepenthes gracilis TaxID=150966 RepID=A0AAD3SJA1_NEPGR|nr:hypothetical protein Nepgr_013670 [Nepenthes gracilis]